MTMSEATQQPKANSTGDASSRPHRYTARMAEAFELKWQQWWEKHQTFRAANPGDAGFDASRPKYYALDMFPYPSGAGLHVGHPEGYIGTDIVSRFKRMTGYNVLHPMGWDAFGLPAEQYAIQTNVHPAKTTRQAIDTFRRQLQRFGFSYDWSREIATIDEGYYRWTQWIFLKLYDAWYDLESESPDGRGGARPIQSLVDLMASGAARVAEDDTIVRRGDGAFADASEWGALAPDRRRRVINNNRLAYIDEQTVNWCPKLGTVLANEEVIDGKSERGGFPVVRRPLRQWMFRITAYAERLLADLEDLDWPSSTKVQQAEWIGRSEGAEIDFPINDPPPAFEGDGASGGGGGGGEALRVFTTRPDTIFGATYMVVAPEHPLIEAVLADPRPETPADALRAYVNAARNRTDIERQEAKTKSGVFTGLTAINPATEKPIPIWTADYVLTGYGTGAIMAVPGQDQRDWDFAKVYDLPIVRTVQPSPGFDGEAYVGEGPAINSGFLDGLEIPAAKAKIIDWLESHTRGTRKINYRIRDWLFSRQRYWGEPFPIVFDDAGNHYPVSMSALPVALPPLDDFKPPESDEPAPLLAKATEWVHTTAGEAGVDPSLLPTETPVRRETNTMPNWAGSCWYYLRYTAPKNADRFTSKEAERYWLGDNGVDLYIGGAEHAVLHLLYARFWHKALFDLGEVDSPEPFRRLFHQGLITSFAFQRDDKSLVPTDEVAEPEEGKFVEKATGKPVTQIVAKMSKSLRNVVNPDDVIHEFGADTFRLYEMYMGPLDASKPWNTRDTIGLFRFLQRVWRLLVDEDSGEVTLAETPFEDVERMLHKTIAKAEADIDRLAFNTAIAAMIEFVNAANRAATTVGGAGAGGVGGVALTRDQADRFVRLLAPFVPHMAEELWSRLGNKAPVSLAPWPEHDPAMLVENEIEIPVQIMGKVRAKIMMPADADAKTMERLAIEDERVQKFLEGKTVRKVVPVPGKLVNIVAN